MFQRKFPQYQRHLHGCPEMNRQKDLIAAERIRLCTSRG